MKHMQGIARSICIFIWIVLAVVVPLPAPNDTVKEIGAPYIRNYSPDEYGADAQNWSIVQDQRGIIYVGNNNCVLEFDGSDWKRIHIPNNAIVRALAIDKKGTVYVGSFNEFGFLAIDAQGKTVYVSLIPKLNKADRLFNDVWKTYVTSHGVYFLTKKKIFLLHDNRIDAIPVDLISRYGFAIDDELFVPQKDQGIFLVWNGQPQHMPYTEKFTGPEAGYVYMMPYRERQVLIVDDEGHFYTYDLNAFYDSDHKGYDFSRKVKANSVLQPFTCDISAYISKGSNILYNAIPISGGRYALATLKGGIIIINDQGGLERVINNDRGLMENSVLNLAVDREKNLWAALNSGIAYVANNSPISRFDAAAGLEGYLLAVVRYKGRIFVGSFNGVSVLDDYRLQLKGDSHHFTFIDSEVHEGWDFLKFDDFLLTASSPKALLIKPNLHYQAFGNGTFYAMARSSRFPTTIFVGTMNGLAVLTIRGNAAGEAGVVFNTDAFPKISDTIRTIVSDANGNLWLGTSYNGLIHVRFNGRDIRDYEVTRFGIDADLPGFDDRNRVHFIDGRLLVGTFKGIFEGIPASPDPPRTPFTRFHPEKTFGKFYLEPPTEVKGIIKDAQNRWWIDSSRGRDFITLDGKNQFQLHHEPLAPIPISVERSYLDERGIFWSPTTKGLYRFDPAIDKDYQTQYPALIRQVTAGKGWLLFQGNYYDPNSKQDHYFTRTSIIQPDRMIPTLSYKENSLIFHFTAPFYEYDSAVRFRFTLEGYDNSWSDWMAQNTKEYTNLPEGSYHFRVRARNIYARESGEAVYRFVIAPPWTRTPLAYMLFTLAGLTLLAGIIKAYTFRLQHEKKRLEKLVAQRTQELKEASLTDPLTGLRNRRYINEILTNDISAFISFKQYVLESKNRRSLSDQQRVVFGIALFDIDHFKMINDTYGHDAGDKVLKQLATILRSSVRADDVVIRTGGEEFLVVLKKTIPDYLGPFAKKIMEKIQQHDFQLADQLFLKRTCSMGYTSFPFYDQDPALISFEQAIMLADLGLYYAKEHGRNLAVKIEAAVEKPCNPEEIQKMSTSLDFALKRNFISINKDT